MHRIDSTAYDQLMAHDWSTGKGHEHALRHPSSSRRPDAQQRPATQGHTCYGPWAYATTSLRRAIDPAALATDSTANGN